jgi:F-box/leucine-rich repeat protein 2/20
MIIEQGTTPRVTDAGVLALTMGCELLESLRVHGHARLTDASLAAAFTHCALLTDVSMYDVAVTDAVLQTRPPLSAPLQKLCCRWEVATAGHSAQSALSGLNFLHITHGLSPDSVDGFCRAVQGMPRLSELTIYPGSDGNKAVPARAIEAIGFSCYQLAKVHIATCIDGNAAGATAALVRSKSELTDLAITNTRDGITDDVMMTIAENCPEMLSLTLSTATILTDDSVTYLARYCPALVHLNLSECTELTDASVLALAAHCPGLRTVNLASSKKFRQPAVVQLVQSCTKLKQLTVFMTGISEETAERLQDERMRALYIDRVGWCDTYGWRGLGGTADY